MIDHVWSVLCWRSVVDRQRNNISLLEAIDRITITGPLAPEGAAIPLELHLVTLWSRRDDNSPCSGRGHMQLLSPSGEIAGESEYDIDLSENLQFQSILHINGIPVKEEGRHTFCVQLQEGTKWKDVARIPFRILVDPSDDQESPN